MPFSAKSFSTILAGSLIVIPAWSGIADVTFPAGYRNWTHVKSAFMGPAHASYNTVGGFRHTYANSKAMEGYRTRVFPEGSVIAFDYIQASDSAGFFSERERRQVDVMEKDSVRFAATGGWGFQRFSSNNARVSAPAPQQCFACHDRLKSDGLVISRYRE